MKFLALLTMFLADRAQNVKPTTVEFYASRLSSFRTEFADRELATLTGGEIHAHLATVGEGRSKSTRRHNIVAWEQLQKFAVERDFFAAALTKPIAKPAMGQRDRIPTDEETAKLLLHASHEFRTLYQALVHCGARPGELCRAQIDNLQRTAKGAAIVLKDHKTAAKTGKPRLIPISKSLLKVLDREIAGRTEGPIFRNSRGEPWTVENLSRTYRQLRDKAGLPRDLVLYLARHEAGTRMCREGGIAVAQKMLGHSNPSMTAKYLHLDVDDVCKLMDELDEETT